VNHNCIHIFRICESICTTCKTFQLFKICDPYIFSGFGRFDPICGVTYFKQLESFVGGTYAITYFKYVNTVAIHTYLY